ncbi:DegT/DnrJ/EryC1/StrS family aminotransferase [Roseivirga thermotolerans]|uniref:Erythromycin biosynthesis sensory transduction protein EryC1 n=1 Tax=Roseivirga thermotolerans TaxID=1758176 RepID=A0ABQ3I6H7_9BACT|nr:DegT/DnrJ/EryC1/StrS family aminotransferase [Roseivirga thermotolerans]GHE68587.1 erythromycin biosynthesis sensory transduction protein EryC1 [Roseivirga thermotolerans]
MDIKFLSFDKINNQIDQECLEAYKRVFDSRWYILGEEVNTFESEYALFSETKYAVGVSNGLEALHLSLRALGVGEGDEVIVPSNTFIATVLAVSYTGATPVFVEPREDTFNIDPEKIEGAITSRTKAIIPVHLYGQACEMKQIMEIADNYKIYVVEDNAQAQGATFNNRKTGSFGHVNATSFYPGKNLGALGDAGAITTNCSELYQSLKTIRNYGSEKKYHNQVIGYNARLDEIQAAFLSVKLKYLNDWNKERKKIAKWYNEGIISDKVIKNEIAQGATSVHHLYVIRTDRRPELQQFLSQKGVETLIHYPIPPHLQGAYKYLGFAEGAFPIAEKLAREVLSLPLYIGMKKDEVDYVCDLINRF